MDNSKKIAYKNRYNAEHYKQWNTLLFPSEFTAIEKARKKAGLSRREFLKALMDKWKK